MGQRHKHADVIIAWAEGKAVQVWDSDNQKWLDVVAEVPAFRCDEYRIKPPPAKKYRVALCADNGGTYTVTADTPADVDFCEKDHSFIRWLTDWVEYSD